MVQCLGQKGREVGGQHHLGARVEWPISGSEGKRTGVVGELGKEGHPGRGTASVRVQGRE